MVLKFQKVINIITWHKASAKIEFEVIVIQEYFFFVSEFV